MLAGTGELSPAQPKLDLNLNNNTNDNKKTRQNKNNPFNAIFSLKNSVLNLKKNKNKCSYEQWINDVNDILILEYHHKIEKVLCVTCFKNKMFFFLNLCFFVFNSFKVNWITEPTKNVYDINIILSYFKFSILNNLILILSNA